MTYPKFLFLIFFIAVFKPSNGYASTELPKQGEIIRGSYMVYTDGLMGKSLIRSIPIPDGDWIVVSAWDRNSVNKAIATSVTPIKLRDMVLAQVNSNNQLIAAIYLTTNTTSQPYKWDPDYCKDTHDRFIYSNTYGTGMWNQRCTTIQPSTYLQSSTPGQNRVRDFYNSKGIKFDGNAIMVQTSEIGHNGDFLRLDFFIFPSVYGLDNPPVGNLTTSPWFKTNYKQDPKKVEFFDNLKKWADEYANLQNQYFSGSDKPMDRLGLFKFNN
jgi:hypothetical protein